MTNERQIGPRVTASSHDNSQVRAFVEVGTFDASAHGNSKFELSVKHQPRAAEDAIQFDDAQNTDKNVDWPKWGSIASVIAVVLAVIALWAMFYLDSK